MPVETKEIIVAHDHGRGPLTAVRRMLVHSSISGIQAAGLYHRYTSVISPSALAEINELIGPGWMPVELVIVHYEACDRLGLDDEQIQTQGLRAGDAMGNALLVANNQLADATGEGAAWDKVLAFSRMGRRIHEGGSAQYVKLGPNVLLIEHKGNPLFAIPYYRTAHLGFLRKTFSRVGIDITDIKLSPFRSADAQTEARVTWR